MNYKGREVTLDNYRKVFEGKPLDILDEIRSALLDSAPIFPYLNRSPEDIHQIRLAMLEAVPGDFFSLPAQVLKEVRGLLASGQSCEVTRSWVSKGLSEEVLLQMIKWERKGYYLDNVNFSYVRPQHFQAITDALRSNQDVAPFIIPEITQGYSPYAVSTLFSIGNPDLVKERLSDETLSLIASHPYMKSWKITSNSSPSTLHALASVRDSLPLAVFNRLAKHDREGYFAFADFQVDRLAELYGMLGERAFEYFEPSNNQAFLNFALLQAKEEKRKTMRGSLRTN